MEKRGYSYEEPRGSCPPGRMMQYCVVTGASTLNCRLCRSTYEQWIMSGRKGDPYAAHRAAGKPSPA